MSRRCWRGSLNENLRWSALPATVPPRVTELLRLCLEKNPARRRQAIGDVRIDLEQVGR